MGNGRGRVGGWRNQLVKRKNAPKPHCYSTFLVISILNLMCCLPESFLLLQQCCLLPVPRTASTPVAAALYATLCLAEGCGFRTQRSVMGGTDYGTVVDWRVNGWSELTLGDTWKLSRSHAQATARSATQRRYTMSVWSAVLHRNSDHCAH